MRGRAVVVAGVLWFVGCKFPDLPPLEDDSAVGDAADGAVDASVDAALDAASCSQTTCSNGVLEVCGASGTVESVETCRLGCFSSNRCNRVDPSNGLGTQVDTSAGLSAVTIPPGATINTDNGEVRSGGQLIAVATETVTQSGGPSLRVYMASSFSIGDVRVSGSLPVAFVAFRDISLGGIVDVSADLGVAGPGAQTCTGDGRGGNQPAGAWVTRRAGHNGTGQYVWSNPGAGGGGFGTVGAKGGDYQTTTGGGGGATNGVSDLEPLRGGCPGGGVNNGNVDVGNGGHGGGAVQLVSATGEIVVMGASPALGGVHAGGGGGRGCDNNGVSTNPPPAGTGCGTGGGGSGGGVLIEAAAVRFESGAVVIASGGGGGGSGGCGNARHGEDAPPNGGIAGGGTCPTEGWGTPAAGGAGAGASASPGGDVTYFAGGGGGGGLGRIRINTVDGTYAGGANLVARGVLTTGAVATR